MTDLLGESLRLHYRAHRRRWSQEEHDQNQLIARCLAGDADAAGLAAASALLTQEREVAEASLIASSSLAEAARGEERRIPPFPWRSSIGLLAAAAAVLVGLRVYAPSAESGESLRPKGADRFDVAVQRGQDRFRLAAHAKVLPGDQLGFFYSSSTKGHLAILSVDAAGSVDVLHPSNSASSTQIEAGVHVPLPDGAIASGGSGCEWIVGVFSDAPIDIRQLRSILKSSPRSTADCNLDPHVPSARAVQTIPVAR
jgi:hypothetical protein